MYQTAVTTRVIVVTKTLSVVCCKKYLAERTGLEPATPGVTGRYSNQLNYRSVVGGC